MIWCSMLCQLHIYEKRASLQMEVGEKQHDVSPHAVEPVQTLLPSRSLLASFDLEQAIREERGDLL